MSEYAENKLAFGRVLNGEESKYMNDCYNYGMISGCDAYCPVLISGKCELQENENKELYKEALANK